jgi:hypothetical protein
MKSTDNEIDKKKLIIIGGAVVCGIMVLTGSAMMYFGEAEAKTEKSEVEQCFQPDLAVNDGIYSFSMIYPSQVPGILHNFVKCHPNLKIVSVVGGSSRTDPLTIVTEEREVSKK